MSYRPIYNVTDGQAIIALSSLQIHIQNSLNVFGFVPFTWDFIFIKPWGRVDVYRFMYCSIDLQWTIDSSAHVLYTFNADFSNALATPFCNSYINWHNIEK